MNEPNMSYISVIGCCVLATSFLHINNYYVITISITQMHSVFMCVHVGLFELFYIFFFFLVSNICDSYKHSFQVSVKVIVSA